MCMLLLYYDYTYVYVSKYKQTTVGNCCKRPVIRDILIILKKKYEIYFINVKPKRNIIIMAAFVVVSV